jgi:hypothetical protein
VTEYKEKGLQALVRSDSPSKMRRVIQGGGSDARLSQVLSDENRAPNFGGVQGGGGGNSFAAERISPLKNKANIAVPLIGSAYAVHKELEKIEAVSAQKQRREEA